MIETIFSVVRGGSWNYGPGYLRAAFRYLNPPPDRNHYFGFRLVVRIKGE